MNLITVAYLYNGYFIYYFVWRWEDGNFIYRYRGENSL